MSRIRYEIFGTECEIADAVTDGGDLTLEFPEGTRGYLYIAGKKYRLPSHSLTLPLPLIDNGIHRPRLITSDSEIPLPPIEKRDRLIALPVEEDAVRSVSLRLARLGRKVDAVSRRLDELEAYVRGATCF